MKNKFELYRGEFNALTLVREVDYSEFGGKVKNSRTGSSFYVCLSKEKSEVKARNSFIRKYGEDSQISFPGAISYDDDRGFFIVEGYAMETEGMVIDYLERNYGESKPTIELFEEIK